MDPAALRVGRVHTKLPTYHYRRGRPRWCPSFVFFVISEAIVENPTYLPVWKVYNITQPCGTVSKEKYVTSKSKVSVREYIRTPPWRTKNESVKRIFTVLYFIRRPGGVSEYREIPTLFIPTLEFYCRKRKIATIRERPGKGRRRKRSESFAAGCLNVATRTCDLRLTREVDDFRNK